MSPEQKIRIRVRVALDSLGYDIHNYLPDAERTFPLIHIGEQFKQNQRINIDRLNGTTQITIHIWHNEVDQEGTVMTMMAEVERVIIKEFGLHGEDIDSQLIVESPADGNMLHGIIESNIKY